MGALDGIRVLDLSRLLPGPYATQKLADLGAEVLKLERPPQGDYARWMPPFLEVETAGESSSVGAVFARVNRGKKSVALDFTSERGRELFLRLAATADVLLESSRPGTLRRHGLDWESLRPLNPRLIYCSLSGYGQTGPLRDRAGHDLNYLALAGILELNGEPERPPVPPPVQIADLAGGMFAATRILAALVERSRTGVGQFLDVALFDAAVDWMDTVVGPLYRAEHEELKRGEMPLTGAYPCYHIYRTSDGEHMSLAALEPAFWEKFCRALDRADLIPLQFDTAATETIAALFASRTKAEWIEISKTADACLEPLLRVSETLDYPQVTSRYHAPLELDRVPRLGQHTRETLTVLGCSQAEIDELAAAGIVVT